MNRIKGKPPIAFVGAAVMLLTVGILFWRYLAGSRVFIFPTMINDGITQFYPGYLEAARNLQQTGSVDFYSFSDGFGAARSYWNPFLLLIILFGENHAAYLMGVKAALCIFLSGWIMGLFLKQAGFAGSTCILGSLSYAFSMQTAGMAGWSLQGELAVSAAVTLLVLERIFRGERLWRWVIWAAADFWLIAACFGLYYQLLYGAAAAVYVLVRAFYFKNGGTAGGVNGRGSGGIGVISDSVNGRRSGGRGVIGASTDGRKCGMRNADALKAGPRTKPAVRRIILITVVFCAAAGCGAVLAEPLMGILSSSRFQNGFAGWGASWADTFSWSNLKSIFTAYARTLSPNIMGIAMIEPYAGSPSGWYSEDGGAYAGLLPLLFIAALPKTDIPRKQKTVMAVLLSAAFLVTVLPGVRLAANGFAGDTFKLSRLWICLALCMCGCLVWESVMVRKHRIGFGTLAVPAAAALLPVLAVKAQKPELLRAGETAAVIIFVLIYLAVFYGYGTGRLPGRACRLVLLSVFGVELLLANYRFINNADALSTAGLQNGYYSDGTREVLALLPEDADDAGILQYRVNKSYESVMCCDPLAQDYYGTTFYRGGSDDVKTTAFLQDMGVASKSNKAGYCTGTYGYPALSAAAGVRYGISEESVYMEQGFVFQQNLGNKTLYENRNTLPIAFGYTQIISEEELEPYTVRERHDILLQACILDAQTCAALGRSEKENGGNAGRAAFLHNPAKPLRELTVEDYQIGTPIEFAPVSSSEIAVVNLENEKDICVDLFWSTTKGRWSEKDYRTLSIYEKNQNTFIEIDNQEEINGIILYLNDDDPAEIIDRITIQVYDRAQYERFLAQQVHRLSKSCADGDIVMKQDGILFVSIPYGAPFAYYLNGQRCDTVRANYIFTGIPVEKGRYRLEVKRESS